LAAQALLADPRDIVRLMATSTHGNVLDGGERGWLAIDPKGLLANGPSTSSTSCEILMPAGGAGTGRFGPPGGSADPLPHRSSGSAFSTGRWPSPPVGGVASGGRYAPISTLPSPASH